MAVVYTLWKSSSVNEENVFGIELFYPQKVMGKNFWYLKRTYKTMIDVLNAFRDFKDQGLKVRVCHVYYR